MRSGTDEPTPSARSTERGGIVYLLECQGYYKIGRTANPDVSARLSSIQTGNPFWITLVDSAVVPNCCEVERELHKRFDAYRVRGEWFKLPDEALTDVRSTLAALTTVQRQPAHVAPALSPESEAEMEAFFSQFTASVCQAMAS